MSSELETNIVSVERAKEYTETPTEVRKLNSGLATLAVAVVMSLVSKSDQIKQNSYWVMFRVLRHNLIPYPPVRLLPLLMVADLSPTGLSKAG